ncbi:MAG: PstS family phosphate ABC transporter substrate-binding protein [Zetaproteobacteria bacterium]|nr:PstS family phosphate ABC transporter substrate-binding protein [Zetaproteobacteria bacterium]
MHRSIKLKVQQILWGVSLGSSLCATSARAVVQDRVRIDGSSTVYPITEAVAEEFGRKSPEVRVTVGVSGTGGGFKKFLQAETDINNASRKIKDSEKEKAKAAGIQYMEIPVAYDGISVVIHRQNDWVDYLTVAELHEIWKPGSKITKWSQVRAGWPDLAIKLYGPGTHSGTFDYFTHAINGKSQSSRADFTKSEDDNILVRGVAGDRGALGFFGLSYYVENKKSLRAVPIQVPGGKPVAPAFETVFDGSYKPLARQIYMYVNISALQKANVKKFISFYLKNARQLVKDVGYVPLATEEYERLWSQVQKQPVLN